MQTTIGLHNFYLITLYYFTSSKTTPADYVSYLGHRLPFVTIDS